jgi:hypothetical protein
VIFQILERGAVELGITNDVSRGVDESHAMTSRDTRFIRQRVGVYSWPPFRREKSRFARQIVCRLRSNIRVYLVVDDDYDRHYHDCDDRERLEQQPLG